MIDCSCAHLDWPPSILVLNTRSRKFIVVSTLQDQLVKMRGHFIAQGFMFSVAAAMLKRPQVQTGLDVLIESDYAQLQGKKVLVLTNPTGITPGLDLGVDVMVSSGRVKLFGIMGPEHGFRGTSENGGEESTFVDAKTGLTVYVSASTSATLWISTSNMTWSDMNWFCRTHTTKIPQFFSPTLRSQERIPSSLISKMLVLDSTPVRSRNPNRKAKTVSDLKCRRMGDV